MRVVFYIIIILFFILTLFSSSAQNNIQQTINDSFNSKEVIDIQQRKIDNLAEKVNNIEETARTYVSVLGVIGLFFGIIPLSFTIFFSYQSSSRAGEIHKLSMASEQSAQARAAEVHEAFLGESQKTLSLVNETLTLAKEASERAAKVIEDKATSTLEELDQKSKSLLAISSTGDDRAIIADPATRSDLTSLADKINGFEIQRGILPIAVKLTAPCLFIRGMDFHLKQNYDDAFLCWKNVANLDEATPELRSLAWYWIGYENNNLGRYSDAEASFTQALDHADGVREFELRRIRLESRFFNQNKYSANSLVSEIEDLSAEIDGEKRTQEIRQHTIKILITHGNILFQAGRDLRQEGKNAEAVKRFSAAAGKYEQVCNEDKWAQFGLAVSLDAINKKKTMVKDLFTGPIRKAARDEFFRRVEPRTKVLARTTEFICCLKVEKLRSQVAAILGDITQSLGEVDGRLTVFSQIQKRNVTKDEFREDINKLLTEEGMGELAL